MFRKSVVFILVIMSILTAFPAAAGGSIASMQQKQKELQNQINEIRKKAEELKGQQKSVQQGMDMIQLIIQSDVELLKSITEQKGQVEALKEQQEIERLELTAVINSLNAKHNEITVASRSKEIYMSSLQKDIKEMERQQSAMDEQSKQIERDILAAQRAVEYAGGELLWPLPGYYTITSHFGGRADPITGVWSSHGGTDIRAPYGTPILSANDGVVIFSGWHYSYGNYVIVDHGGGIATLYAHASKLLVSKGDPVLKGDPVALVGSTGYSTGNHLHLEVRVNGVRKDAETYYTKKQ